MTGKELWEFVEKAARNKWCKSPDWKLTKLDLGHPYYEDGYAWCRISHPDSRFCEGMVKYKD